MIVNFFPDGTVEHTLKDAAFKPELGGAKREIERMTEIKHDAPTDRFYAQMVGSLEPISIDHLDDLRIVPAMILPKSKSLRAYSILVGDVWYAVPTFETYEEAVAFEILYTDALRLRGVSLTPKT